ncbi:MAG: universal stress protein [Candidatus Competibacteraceae bacterium]
MTVVPDITAGMDWSLCEVRQRRVGALWLTGNDETGQGKNHGTGQGIGSGRFGNCMLAKHGSIYKEILDVAEEINADLIFMAAYRPSVKDYLLGSNASRVVRHARCSVTVVRDKE